jgi:hypothetical protein
VRFGFWLFGRREQLAFLHSTLERMRRLSEIALEQGPGEPVRKAAEELTARPSRGTARANARLADYLEGEPEPETSTAPGG